MGASNGFLWQRKCWSSNRRSIRMTRNEVGVISEILSLLTKKEQFIFKERFIKPWDEVSRICLTNLLNRGKEKTMKGSKESSFSGRKRSSKFDSITVKLKLLVSEKAEETSLGRLDIGKIQVTRRTRTAKNVSEEILGD
jgi:hypothetical protein